MKRALLLVVVLALLGGVAWLAVQRGSGGSTVSTAGEAGEAPMMLDQYIGFGRTEASALRDDSVALWEAFKREQSVAACMENAGFSYAPDPAYPDAAQVTVSNYLKVTPVSKPVPYPSETNKKIVASLPDEDLDRYYQALYGESLKDIRAVEKSGGEVVPHDHWREGGCTGAAATEVGSLWDAKRELADQIDEMNQTAAKASAAEYSSCVQPRYGSAVKDPSDLEEVAKAAADGSARQKEAVAAYDACDATWRSAFQRHAAQGEARLIEANQARFDGIAKRYAGVETEVRQDAAFKTYLSIMLRSKFAGPNEKGEGN